MMKYAKICDDKTKVCMVGHGEDIKLFKSLGMSEMEVEEAWDGAWYVSGYAPDKPQEIKDFEEITDLKRKLADSDYAIIKIAEGAAAAEDYADLIEERAKWRARINELEGKE